MDHPVGGTRGLRLETYWYQTRESRYGRHDRPAVDGIDELHQVRIMRMRIFASPQRLQGLAPLVEGVDEQRIGFASPAVVADRSKVAPPTQARVACRTRGRPGAAILSMFHEAAVQHL